MEIALPLGIIAVSSIAIYFICDRFALASSRLGDHLKIPRSVKGATFDAIASSLPELLVALFAVIFFNSFEVGIGTIAGSALFNLLIIPGIGVLVSPIVFRVSRRVITRDALFYVLSVFTLVVATLYFKTWGLIIALVFIFIYMLYIKVILYHVKKDREEFKPEHRNVNVKVELLAITGTTILIGVVTYFLTDASIDFANAIGVSPIIVAFVLTAAATSVPDTVISVFNAKKGDIDDAVSNVFGSNTFDILVGLGLPLFIFNLISGPVNIDFINIEILFGLMGATIVVLLFLAEDHVLEKSRGIAMLILYGVFIAYIVLLAINPEKHYAPIVVSNNTENTVSHNDNSIILSPIPNSELIEN